MKELYDYAVGDDIAPCKPHPQSTHTDRLPMAYREGALDASKLPSRTGNTLTYPDGRKETLE